MPFTIKIFVPVAAISAVLSFTACTSHTTPTGPELHESRSVELDKAEQVRVEMHMPAGELDLRGGAQKLLDADFTYNVPSWKPDVRYSSSGSFGDLTVEQHGAGSSGNNAKNHWDLRLNDGVPVDLRVRFGAGEGRLNLGSMTLRSVDLEMGAGTLDMDLRGTPKKDYSVRIRGGVGEATVHLPKDVGIVANASGGIGDVSVTGLNKDGDRYTNEAYERANVHIRLDVQGGVGTIKLIAE